MAKAIFIGLNFYSTFFFFLSLSSKENRVTSEMLTHARLCKVLACVALKKGRNFSAFFFLAVAEFGIPFLDGGKDFRQSLPRS